MFVVSVRSFSAQKRAKLVAFLTGALLTVVCAIVLFAAVSDMPDATAHINSMGEYSTALTDSADAEKFAGQFSLELGELCSAKMIVIPCDFNDTYNIYNKIQKRQGLDLAQHKGKECVLYMYELKNYTIDYQTAFLSIIVYRNRVIGGHISTAVADSTIYTFSGE